MYAVMRKYDGAPQLRELVHRHMHQELFDQRAWWPVRPTSNGFGGRVPLDVSADSDGYVVEAELPGMNLEAIDLQIIGDTLTISGEYKVRELDGRQYLVQQRQAGTFQTSIKLADAVDAAKIVATYEHGVLRLSVPKSEAAKPTHIQLTAAK